MMKNYKQESIKDYPDSDSEEIYTTQLTPLKRKLKLDSDSE